MFIGVYELEGQVYNNIYYYGNWKNSGLDLWFKDTFDPDIKNIRVLNFKIKGKNYRERQASLEDLAKDWQYDFSYLPWSYGELAEILNYFYENAKKYGLVKIFKENGIC